MIDDDVLERRDIAAGGRARRCAAGCGDHGQQRERRSAQAAAQARARAWTIRPGKAHLGQLEHFTSGVSILWPHLVIVRRTQGLRGAEIELERGDTPNQLIDCPRSGAWVATRRRASPRSPLAESGSPDPAPGRSSGRFALARGTPRPACRDRPPRRIRRGVKPRFTIPRSPSCRCTSPSCWISIREPNAVHGLTLSSHPGAGAQSRSLAGSGRARRWGRPVHSAPCVKRRARDVSTRTGQRHRRCHRHGATYTRSRTRMPSGWMCASSEAGA